MTTNPTLLDLRAELNAAEKEFRLLEIDFGALLVRIRNLEAAVNRAIAHDQEASRSKRLGLLSGSLFSK